MEFFYGTVTLYALFFMALSKSFYLYLGSIDGLRCTEHSPCISGDCIETEDGISCINCSPGKKINIFVGLLFILRFMIF